MYRGTGVIHLSWPFSRRRVIDPGEQSRAIEVYRRLFTQPKRLATLRAEFDAAVKAGSENGTNPELLKLLQDHAMQISRLMSKHWESVIDGTEERPRMRTRRGFDLTTDLTQAFVSYIEKTLRWLEYFILDPRWLNLTAVNYAANAAREAASEVKDARLKLEQEFELNREMLVNKRRGQHSDAA